MYTRYAIYMYLRLMAPSSIFDPSFSRTEFSKHSSAVLPDTENMGLTFALAISFLSRRVYTEIRVLCFLSTAILDFWLPVMFDSVADGTIETFEPENMGVAAGILFPASLEAEVYKWELVTKVCKIKLVILG